MFMYFIRKFRFVPCLLTFSFIWLGGTLYVLVTSFFLELSSVLGRKYQTIRIIERRSEAIISPLPPFPFLSYLPAFAFSAPSTCKSSSSLSSQASVFLYQICLFISSPGEVWPSLGSLDCFCACSLCWLPSPSLSYQPLSLTLATHCAPWELSWLNLCINMTGLRW